MSPLRAFLVTLAALLLGALLNAESLAHSASVRPPGWQRDLATTLTDGLVDVSRFLQLDHPARWIADIRGRDESGVTPSPATGPAGVFTPTEDRPVRLWVTGDSLTQTLGPALVNQATATGVIEARDEVVYSAGLTRPDFFDWPDHLARSLAQQPVEIVVFMIGANDGQPILTPDGWMNVDSESWSIEYRSRVAETMDVLASWATSVYWVGQPIARSESLSAQISVMNSIFGAEAAVHDRVRYVDSWDLFTDDEGGYSAWLPNDEGRMVLMRDDDGVHLTPAGADVLASDILDTIRQDWDVG